MAFAVFKSVLLPPSCRVLITLSTPPEQPEMLLTGPFCVLIKSFCATPATRFLAKQKLYLHLAHLHNAFHNPLMLQLLEKSLKHLKNGNYF
jgi:hypothetical protein